MKYTLLLLYDALIQSCGCESYFNERKTALEPTYGEVIGTLRSAIGRAREDDFTDLTTLSFAVRVDQPGHIANDYQIAQVSPKKNEQINKYYMEDSVFLVGLESDSKEFLEELEDALRHPCHGLYEGRKNCPVTENFIQGIREGDLENVMLNEPWYAREYEMESKAGHIVKLEVVMDARGKRPTESRKDFPISSTYTNRSFGYRPVVIYDVEVENPLAEDVSPIDYSMDQAEHDPMSAIPEN